MPVPVGIDMIMRYNLFLIMHLRNHWPGYDMYQSILQYVVFQHTELWNFSFRVKGKLITDR